MRERDRKMVRKAERKKKQWKDRLIEMKSGKKEGEFE